MTTPETLAELQSAWGSPIVDVQSGSATTTRRRLQWLRSAECNQHLPPFDAVEEPDPKRFGFIRSNCRRCGRFIGYRQAEQSK